MLLSNSPAPKSNPPRAIGNILSFLAFLIAYYLPFFIDKPAISASSDDRVEILIKELLSKPTAWIEITRDLAAHIALLLMWFLFLSKVAQLFGRLCGIRKWLAQAVVFLAGWIFLAAANAAAFSRSNYSLALEHLARPEYAYVLGSIFGIVLLVLLARTLVAYPRVCGATAVAVLAMLAIGSPPASGAYPHKGPHIIIVGVDSLSEPTFTALRNSLPNINELASLGTIYTHAYTPLGRTYPAWMSILSGQTPAEHGAIENLRSFDYVTKKSLISKDLQTRGYQTVFAIDERRFNNIDQSFGFDAVVGPKAGALDFVMQWFNDTPLTNALMLTKLARYFVPFSYFNTESVVNYDAKGFVDAVSDAAKGSKPLFLAVHFESAHFPFTTRHATREFHGSNEFFNRQAAALTVVDIQVGRLMSELKTSGYLEDALVVLLSDHGEGFGDVEAHVTEGGEPIEVRSYGHGGSVLSDRENHIVLSVAEFRNGHPVTPKSEASQLVSLLDIRPLISQYVNTRSNAIETPRDCMTVETGVRLTANIDYKSLDEATLASAAAENYEIDQEGRLRLREDHIAKLIQTKDVGLRCLDRLTYFSYIDNKYFSYALDQTGEPTAELPAAKDDVRRIESYRARLSGNSR